MRCKTCGGELGHHKASILDPTGKGHPNHRMPESNKDAVITETPSDSNVKAGSEVRDIDVPKMTGSEDYYSLTNFMSRVLPAYDEARINKKYIQGLTPQQWLENHLSKYIQSLIAQSSAQAELRSANQKATVDADLSWCIGKLRGLGFPAPHLEEKYGITKFEETQLRAQGGGE